MISTIFKTSMAAAAALAFGISAASAATVMNGSFEQDAGTAQDGQAFSTLATGTGGNSWSVFNSLPHWTKVDGGGIEIQTANTVGLTPQDGQHYVELDSTGNSSMKQTINFGSTGSYLLSFYYSPRDDGRTSEDAASNAIDYSLFDALSPLTTVLAGSVTGPGQVPFTAFGKWTQITAKFVITQTGDYNLMFAAGGRSNTFGGFIDNVSIVPVPVPVPAAGFLLIGALGGLAALRRRRKTA
jgi:hypothetical protein